ncbi:MAG: NAD(P)/FAD-dependent oxidoreductase [Armatimonadota bacterium]|nr:NAD(P)/FAD-dependent oxidoreductase [Armatimonadota bacterium]MDR7401703.1 NAD(P)/FAD-dependent oxidoreductase [Armatimonadota bacterium]MDR7404148.1 NAD(P)/FAD-dependent oxidoreductase [Armatimonadota bacterium]MDR7436287.1 NAD(P)/FAD-dependent oxidoreductase [Armatimonadota bacterium]MDR7471333.1 NAD(P)/FAD-dependent oxidoreductase [Armatimonadota bacterium]
MATRADYDVIVVGSGPAGAMAALRTAARGLRTLVVEEHPAPGTPAHCSGKIQVHAFREFGLPGELILTALRAGTFYGPGGSVARVRRPSPDSFVVDRAEFDRWLAARAQEAGAHLALGTRVRAAQREGGLVRVTGERGGRTLSATAPVVVDAEGARPVLPRALGLRLPRRMVHGLQYECTGVDVECDDCPELYLGRAWAPGFFGWLMPLGGTRARVGVCVDPRLTDRPPAYFLDRLIREHPVASRRLRAARVRRRLGGPIPLLAARHRTSAEGLIVVGDAAGHVKATSGGGIYFSLIGGDLAAAAAAGYVGGDRSALAAYERGWRRRFGRELRATAAARLALAHMSDADVDAVVEAVASDRRLRDAIQRRGDTAFQSRLLAPLVAHALRPAHLPRLAGALAALVRYGLRALWDDGVAEENEGGEGNR